MGIFDNDDTNANIFGGASIMGDLAREQVNGGFLSQGNDAFGNATNTIQNPLGMDTHIRTFADGSTEEKTGLFGW